MYTLRDVTGDDLEPEPVSGPQAEAVFCSGQIVSDGEVKNSVEGVMAAARPGWPSAVPLDYEFLHGTWPTLRREVALLLAHYLASAIQTTRRRRAAGPQGGEINITGAVSWLFAQQVSTVKAADFVKRLLQFDEGEGDIIFKEYPILREALAQALRIRPRQPIKADDTTAVRDDYAF